MADNYQIDVTLEEIFGTGIRSVEQTVVSHDPGGVNIWTVTLTNGVQTQMEVRNGDSGGAPVPAYSASEMTDTSAIYLYVGNEEGYNNAHWYVFKDDAWTDFGTYGYPQEAQDRIDEIEADLNESIDDIAESMDSFQSDMENRYDLFVAEHSGQNGETVLFDAGASPVFSGALTLSDDPANYDYIKVTWKHRYNVCVQEFPVSSIGNGCYLNDSLANVSGSSGMFEICQLVLTQDTPGTSARIASARLYDSTGSATGDVTANDNTGIYQIIGVKPMADPEVTDIRLGADGTVYPSAGAAVRGQITDLKSAIQQSSGLTADVKQALMDFANAVAFKSNVPLGQTYIDALEDALYPPADLVSISAVYTQSGDVYPDTSLDDLKTDLVVTAHYDNSTTEIVTTYTLSGTLTVGTSVITVSYGGKTTTFNVTVSSDGLIYSLVDHVFDGTINTQVDSGVKLLETDQSFTILIDLMTTTAQQSSPSWRLLHCMDTNARGINFGRGVNGGVVEKWMSVYEEISSNDFANLSGSHKVVVTHEAGSNSATYMYRLGTNAVNSRTVSDSAFYANDTTLYIGGSPGNNRALTGTGTVKIYDSVLSQARINEFLGV